MIKPHPRSILIALLLLAVLSISPFFGASSQPRTVRDVEQQINALLRRMTLEEKLGQLQQLDGEANGNYRPEHRDLVRKGVLGIDFERAGRAAHK
jgi:type II secretory pathway component PulJ